MFIKYLQLYMVTLGAFLVIDMIWLGLVARKFYRDQQENSIVINWVLSWGRK